MPSKAARLSVETLIASEGMLMLERVQHPPKTQDNPWEDLVISILSVNQYSLEKAYVQAPLLRENGLFSPENLSKWDIEEIAARLRSSGYDRGSFMTNLFAVRLACLGVAAISSGLPESGRILLSNEPKAIRSFLLPIKGIGPQVLQNFFLLREIK
jgi:endonuclease III-like uncharacterized protein